MKLLLDHNNKLHSLESSLETEKRLYHESKLEIADLEDKIQSLKHENLLLTTKVEELNFSMITLKEQNKKLSLNYESQMEDLTASQNESKAKIKEKYRLTCSELEVATAKIAELQNNLEGLYLEIGNKKENIEALEKDNEALREEIEGLNHTVESKESTIAEKIKLIQSQKSMRSKLASQKDDMALDFEKQEKLMEVEITDRNAKIEHLQDMLYKYKKVIDKVDSNLKQLPQEFAIKLMVVEKKLKREREAKSKAQDEIKALKREILEKESQIKRYSTTTKNQELKAFVEWDMNSFQSQPQQEPHRLRASYTH